MNELQVLAEVGRLHLENLRLNAENIELQRVIRDLARNPAVEPTDTMTGDKEAPGDPKE